MGMCVCVCSTSERITAPLIVTPPVPIENASRLDPAIKRKLIDLKKVRSAPVLCLEVNVLYKRRIEGRNDMTSETMCSPNTAEDREQVLRVPFSSLQN